MRWPLGAKDVSHPAEAQAAMIRLTGRGSPAEDNKKAARLSRSTVSVLRGCRRASLKHRARNAGVSSAVRGDYARVDKYSHPTRGCGLAEARRSARPSLRRASCGGLDDGVPRAAKQQGRRSFVFELVARMERSEIRGCRERLPRITLCFMRATKVLAGDDACLAPPRPLDA